MPGCNSISAVSSTVLLQYSTCTEHNRCDVFGKTNSSDLLHSLLQRQCFGAFRFAHYLESCRCIASPLAETPQLEAKFCLCLLVPCRFSFLSLSLSLLCLPLFISSNCCFCGYGRHAILRSRAVRRDLHLNGGLDA